MSEEQKATESTKSPAQASSRPARQMTGQDFVDVIRQLSLHASAPDAGQGAEDDDLEEDIPSLGRREAKIEAQDEDAIVTEAKNAVNAIRVPLRYTLTQSVTEFLRVNNLEPNTTSFEMFSLLHYGVKRGVKTSLRESAPMITFKDANGNDRETKLADARPGQAHASHEQGAKLVTAAQASFDGIAKRYLMLVSCGQIVTLTDMNIENLYKSYKANVAGARVNEVIKFLSSADVYLFGLPGVENYVRSTDWGRYHSNASSTPALAMRFFEEVPAAFLTRAVKRALGYNAVVAAYENMADKALSDRIPAIAIQYTYLWLEANEALPRNWFQGNKAIARMSEGTKRIVRQVLTLLIRKSSAIPQELQDASTQDIARFLAFMITNSP